MASDHLARRMKLGVMPSMGEDEQRGRAFSYAEIRDMAQTAEGVGLDSFWLADHLLYRFPGKPEAGAWEVFTFLGAVAQATERISIGPLVACTSFRNPALLAKMAESLDEISAGRFILGLGAGWHEPEYTAFGYPFDHRAARFEEALKIIVPLLRDGHVDFRGQYYEASDIALRPRGPQRNGPPIWIGASKPRMLRFVAHYADAWNTVWHKWPQSVAEKYPQMLEACRAVGRDPATLELTAGTWARILAPGEQREPDEDRIVGSPEEVAQALKGFADLGVKHLVVLVEPESAEGIVRLGEVAKLLDQMG
ncbi:MAG TPA: LLM class flavin-dependent oxidoreductase [Ktedonobacterales bacterium]|nr:LLM class flavin-dependent oxidoreductase [Ktedonobacterales bacterium]